MAGNFHYVVNEKVQPKVCFGSGLSRDCAITRNGMSPFMKCHSPENFPNVGPGAYEIIKSYEYLKTKLASTSNRGYGGLVQFHPRTLRNENFPGPCDYSPIVEKKVREYSYPYQRTKRVAFPPDSSTQVPGPGMYVQKVRKKFVKNQTADGDVHIQLAVEIKCCSKNKDVCKKCGKKPIGDYWHLEHKIFLCRVCMFKERLRLKHKVICELDKYKKIRDCSRIHYHEGTRAKIWLVEPKTIRRWALQETYLNTYFPD